MGIDMYQNKAQKSPADVNETVNKKGSVANDEGENVTAASANTGEIKMRADEVAIAYMITEEKKLINLRMGSLVAVYCFLALAIVEICHLLAFTQLGFDAINTPVYWTEVALVMATFVVSLLAVSGVGFATGVCLVPYLMFVLPRVAAPVIFIALSDPNDVGRYAAHTWIVFSVAAFAVCGVLAWYSALRYYRQLATVKAVHDFLKKHNVA